MRTITAKFGSKCPECKTPISAGDEITYDPDTRKAYCSPECAPDDPEEKPDPGSQSLADKLGFKN